ncbi:MAG: hypothetical protein ACI9Y1_003296 [Lentisphaeria bacterium]|jgi:hypothetical protein
MSLTVHAGQKYAPINYIRQIDKYKNRRARYESLRLGLHIGHTQQNLGCLRQLKKKSVPRQQQGPNVAVHLKGPNVIRQ